MVTGLTRSSAVCLDDVGRVIDHAAGQIAFGLTVLPGMHDTLFVADTSIHERPSPEQIADIAMGAAQAARRLGHEPRVALLSHSTFGNPDHPAASGIRQAVRILDERGVDFEYDGEMSPDVAFDPIMRERYPFCRLTGNANVLVMPGLHSAHIAASLAMRFGGGGTIGPLLIGLQHPVQIVRMGASVSQIVDMAVLAAHQAIGTTRTDQ